VNPSLPPRSDRPLLALLMRAIAMLLLSTMLMLVKLAGEAGVSAPEMLFWRMAVTIPVLGGWLILTGRLHILATRRMASHARRAATGMAGLFCNVVAAMLLPLAEATTFGFTTPLFAVMMAALVMKQKVGLWRWTVVVMGFVGVLIIAQPGHAPVSAPGVAAGLGAGILVAAVSFQVRDLAATENPISCVFWFAFWGAVMAAILMPYYAKMHPPKVWLLIVAIGLCGTFAQFFITSALRFGQVATVVVMDYTSLVWATLYGVLLWDHLPTRATWLGAPLIIVAGMIITWREHYLSKAVSPTSAMDEGAGEDAATK